MLPVVMTVNVLGRIRNTHVPYAHALIPLFEAVINSIHSTQDRFGTEVASQGKVNISIERTTAEPTIPGIAGRPPVQGIARINITDNGNGFTDDNLLAFATADTTDKIDRGGKGVGRFSWLVVFEQAFIDSTIEVDDNSRVRRTFRFVPTKEGIEDYKSGPSRYPISTTISLSGLHRRYSEPMRIGPETIADRLFEHCFNYIVLSDSCPVISITEDCPDECIEIVVNDLLKEVSCDGPLPLKIGDHELLVLHTQRKHSTGHRHEAHLCANQRIVESFGLSECAHLSPDPYRNDDGVFVVHHAFVSGKALDDACDSSRTRLDLPESSSLLDEAGSLNLQTLKEGLGAHVEELLSEVLAAERAENYKHIESHIRTKQPEYRHLLSHRKDALERIRWSSDDVKLDERLYHIQQEWDIDVRRRQQELEDSFKEDDTDLEVFADELAKIIESINEQGQANLVRYVVKRRAVLKLLRRLISVTAGPAPEDRVHRIIFPLRSSADEIEYGDHNLWLIDDTLSFYEYVSSDKPFSMNDASPSGSLRRPDILAFKTGDPFQHVSIVEFKRPERDDENPVQQLVDYAILLRKGGARNAEGATMPGVPISVRIDAIALCSLTPNLVEQLKRGPGDMHDSPEEGRWYGAVTRENLWIEVLDFQTLIRRAEQRNRALFTQLGLR